MAETLTQTLRLVAEGEAVTPRLLNPGVPRDLETVCIKCLDKEPKRRYATAQELADELGRFLKGEPIHARPIAPAARLARWCRRKPALAISLGAVAMLFLTVVIGFPVAFTRVNRARQLAEAAHGQTQQQLYSALLEQARATVRSGELGQRVQALGAIRRAAAITISPELRREAFTALALPDLRLEREIATGSDVTLAQFRADGRECVIRTPGGLQRFSFERPATLRELNAEMVERLHRGTFSRDGRWLVVTGRDRLGLWDWAADPAPVVKAYAEAAALTADPDEAVPFFTPDSAELFGSWNNGIGHWHLGPSTNGNMPVQLDPLPVNRWRRLYSAFLCSNELVLTGQGGVGLGGVEFVALTNLGTGPGRLYTTYDNDRIQAGIGMASPDARWLSLRKDWQAWVDVHWLPTMEFLRRIIAGADVMNFAFAPGSDELAVATSAGVEFYDTTRWERTRLLPMPIDRYANLIFAPDGRSLWVSKDSRSAALYDPHTLEVLFPLPTGTLPLAVSPDGRNLAVSVDGRRLQVWDLVELRRQFRDLGVDWESAP